MTDIIDATPAREYGITFDEYADSFSHKYPHFVCGRDGCELFIYESGSRALNVSTGVSELFSEFDEVVPVTLPKLLFVKIATEDMQ